MSDFGSGGQRLFSDALRGAADDGDGTVDERLHALSVGHIYVPVKHTMSFGHNYARADPPKISMVAEMASQADRRRRALQDFMKARNLKAKPWAKEAGVAPATIPNFLKHRSESLTASTLEKLAAAADATVAEIIGEKIRPARTARDVVAIKSLEVRAAMGGGYEVAEEPEGPPYFFRREWIEELLEGKPARLRALGLGGDSMYPTIHDGDLGVANLDAPFESGGVYVFWDGQGLMVKRLEAYPGRRAKLRVISDNRAVSEPYIVDAEDIRIIGRIVWRGGRI